MKSLYLRGMSLLLLLTMLLLYCGCKKQEKAADSKQEVIQIMEDYLNQLSTLPVSFYYRDQIYHGLGADFTEISRSTAETEHRTETSVILLHKDQLLQITLYTAVYPDYGAYEWTLYFQNTGTQRSGRLSAVRCVDMYIEGSRPVLKGIGGDSVHLYAPYEKDLTVETAVFRSDIGRPTHGGFPYFNLEYGSGGLLMAIGWPGCWEAEFSAADNGTTHVTGGLYGFDSDLLPGETVRSPLMAFVKYNSRDAHIAANAWRHWYIDCNMPKINGNPYPTILAAGSNRMTSLMTGATEKNQVAIMERIVEHGIPISYWWMDAGWYAGVGGKRISSWWDTGTLQVDSGKFPTGLAAVTEACAEHGIKTLLWFEPEWFRLDLEAFLAETPDFDRSWLILYDSAWTNTGHPWYLLHFGIPACREWVFNRVCNVLDTAGISVYRQDFNANPGPSWRYADEAGRAGMTENLYVQGYLAYWDALRQRYPDMMIDSCASGGGRNDLETMRRSVPLTRSDYNYCDYNIRQSMIQSLNEWLPYHGSIGPTEAFASVVDGYGLRSSYCASLDLTYSVNKTDFDWELLKSRCEEFLSLKDYVLADYYPLTEWSSSDAAWRGWEYFDPEKDEGVLQLFRPEKCGAAELKIKLYGLHENQVYLLTDTDGVNSCTATGRELMERGITIVLAEPRSAAVVMVQPAK